MDKCRWFLPARRPAFRNTVVVPMSLDPIVASIPDSKRRLLRITDGVALRIASVMREKGLNQVQLAQRSKKSKSYVSRVLSGTVNLTLKTIAEFEAALGADILSVEKNAERPVRRRRDTAQNSELPVKTDSIVEQCPCCLAVHECSVTDTSDMLSTLPVSLRGMIESTAAQERTTVERLLLFWIMSGLQHSTVRSRTHLYFEYVLDKMALKEAWEMTFAERFMSLAVSIPAGYPSSAYSSGSGSQGEMHCVSPRGELVLVTDFTTYSEDESE